MEANSSDQSRKKTTLEVLSKEELITRYERLLIIAQKAKQAKDSFQEENLRLKDKLEAETKSDGNAVNELIENLTQQKLLHVTSIEDLKKQNTSLRTTLEQCNVAFQECQEKNNELDNENRSFKRQMQRLTDENEQLISDLDLLEKQMEECKKLGLEQQNQLLELEKSKQSLEDANQRLQEENKNNHLHELQMKIEEIKKLEAENCDLKGKLEDLKMNLTEKDKNIVVISEELQSQSKLAKELQQQVKEMQEIETIKEQKDAFEYEKNKLSEINELLKREIDDLKEKQQNSVLIVKDIEDVNCKLKEKLKLYHSKIVKLAGDIKVVKEDKNEVFGLFKSYMKQVEEWKMQLITSSQKLCHHINNINDENRALKESNAKFMEQLKAHKTDDEKSKELSEIEDIKSENKKLSEEISRQLEHQTECETKIDSLTAENESLKRRLTDLVMKHQEELRAFDDQSKKDNIEIRNRKEENEKICIEYRKIISKLEEDISLSLREIDELQQKNHSLHESLENSRETEKQIAERTSEEILKLVQENAELLKINRELKGTRKNVADAKCQTDGSSHGELEEVVASLKRENSELLAEMNEMNQALKERGETISKFQSHCEEIMKKLQIYETQANKNVDNISQKEEIIKRLEQEIEKLENRNSLDTDVSRDVVQKDMEIAELKSEIENLKEKINSNLDASYAENEAMSTSTISRLDEASRLKDLEGSWEERYGKLRTLAVKLKGKVRDLSNELVREQNEKNDIQQKCVASITTISTLQTQCDRLQDELESAKQQVKDYSSNLEVSINELGKNKQKLAESEEIIAKLKKEIEELNAEKQNTETWKRQIGAKVQTFRKELEANKVVRKELEAKVAKLTAELELKEQALKAESDCHQQTRNSLEHSNSERMKNSVLNLEMQDYERSVKELSQKLEKKQEEVNKMRSHLDSQKCTANALREQNKLLEEQVEDMKNEVSATQMETASQKKQIAEREDVIAQKENKILDLTRLLETVRAENEELSTELSKVIAEHQKVNGGLKNEKEHLRSQILGLQQKLREIQDTFKLKEDELKIVQNDYMNYKVRAQSVLRQNQSRDVSLEEKLSEELSAMRVQCETLNTELKDNKNILDELQKNYETLSKEKIDLSMKYEEASGEIEDLKSLYDQLSNKHQQTIIEQGETVRSLKVHAETLAQCFRQQLSEQEVRHNREIIELQSKIEKAPSPTELPYPPLPTMPREEGEGSESIETNNKNSMHPIPLERLLGADADQEIAFIKKQLSEEESKVIHLTALLADTEQDLAKHVQMNKLLKEEIRRHQRSVEREKHAENLEYLKNVVFKFVTLHGGDERSRLVPVLNTILKLSPEETQKLSMVAKGEPGVKGWTNYLPLWPSSSKPS